MGILTWILVGLVAGFVAELILGGGSIGLRGLLMATVLGIVGAILGGFVSVALGFGDVTGFNIRSLVIAICGSLVVIIVFRAVTSGRGNRGFI